MLRQMLSNCVIKVLEAVHCKSDFDNLLFAKFAFPQSTLAMINCFRR